MVQKNSSEYDWAKMLYEKCMLDREDADYYAIKFVKHDLYIEDLPDLTQNVLKNVGISRQGHCLAILKYSKIVRKELERRETPPKITRRTARHNSISSGRSSSRSISPPRHKKRSTTSTKVRSRSRSPIKRRKHKSDDRDTRYVKRERSRSRSVEDRTGRQHTSKKSRVIKTYRSSSEESSRSRSPSPVKKSQKISRKRHHSDRSHNKDREPSPIQNKKSNVAHIDRTSNGKTKLTDDDLLSATIDLPKRFQSKHKTNSVLKKIDPQVKMKFVEDKAINEKLGIRSDDGEVEVKRKPVKDSGNDDKYIFIERSKSRRFENSNGKLKVEVGSTLQKFKKAEKPPNEVKLNDRLGSKTTSTTSVKKDKSLARVEHKEGRFGKTQGMFSLDDILQEDQPKSTKTKDSPKSRSRSNSRSRSDKKSDRNLESRLGNKDKERKSDKNVLSRVGNVNTSVRDRLG